MQQIQQNALHLYRAQTTVDAQSVHAQSFQQRHRRRHISSGEQLALLIKNHRRHHRQMAVFLGRQNGRFHLVAVAHGLCQHQVCTGFLPGTHHLGKQVIGFLKAQVAQRF